jgi:hypothetical protein
LSAIEVDFSVDNGFCDVYVDSCVYDCIEDCGESDLSLCDSDDELDFGLGGENSAGPRRQNPKGNAPGRNSVEDGVDYEGKATIDDYRDFIEGLKIEDELKIKLLNSINEEPRELRCSMWGASYIDVEEVDFNSGEVFDVDWNRINGLLDGHFGVCDGHWNSEDNSEGELIGLFEKELGASGEIHQINSGETKIKQASLLLGSQDTLFELLQIRCIHCP